jgi:hypothetical protein
MPPRPTIPPRPLFFKFTDRLTGRPVSLSLRSDGKLLSRAEFRAEFQRALELIKAEVRFFAQRSSPGCKRRRQQALPSLCSIFAQYSPCGRVRLMFRCVAFACQRLATAPVGVYVISRTTWRWAEAVMERVSRGRVKKLQVRLQRRACSAVRCTFGASACVRSAFGASACVRCLPDARCSERWTVFGYSPLHGGGCIKRTCYTR